MNKTLLIIISFLLSIISYGQSNDFRKMEKWINNNNIEFNNPKTPEHYERYIDCDDRVVFRKNSGDTILVYKWRWTIAEDLKTFKKSMKSEDFNIYRYPTKVQKNGTVIMVHLGLKKLIYRNDTLYLLDTYDKKLADKKLIALELMLNGEISIKEYENRIHNFDNEKSDFQSKFKVIFFKGIFKVDKTYEFPIDLNFRKEKVELISSWTQDELKCYEIKLYTNDSGEYMFNEEMKFIGLENCDIRRKKSR